VELGLRVSDLDAFYEEAQAKGITFTQPPQDLHGTRIARFLDSAGAQISVSEG